MRKLLRGLVHEWVVMAIIAANSIVLILRGYYGWRERTDDVLFLLDYSFTIYFVLELLSKIGLNGWRTFWDDRWNQFDLVVVTAGVPTLAVPIIETHDMSVILILRAVRVMRLLRGFRFIPDRDRLWSGMKRALRASVGLLLGLVVYNVILGLVANALFSHLAPAHFGDPLLAMYSLLKVFTIEGWYEIPDRIAAASSPGMGWLARGYFVFAVLTGGVLGFSITNAVFVDEMVLDNTDQVESRLETLFEHIAARQAEHADGLARLQARLDELSQRLDRS